MKRFNDFESDRYHTAMAAALVCILLASTFLLVASLALRLDISEPALYLAGAALVVVAVKIAGWPGWHSFAGWLRTSPWRSRTKTKTVYQWKRAPLPPPEEEVPRPGQDSTFRPNASRSDEMS